MLPSKVSSVLMELSSFFRELYSKVSRPKDFEQLKKRIVSTFVLHRYLYTLKKYVRNKAHPEGSIAEGYLSDECVIFLSRYLKNVDSRTNRPLRYVDDTPIGCSKICHNFRTKKSCCMTISCLMMMM
ncbi:hypothetical protein MKX01_039451 [Papaver californicum]|nr:hypothetical protein MKX01_039451 [Papaver californicum]